jgi:aspartyl-tRNA(Asn)/glutamyl-tRNA(Gln) amidotransferase subunit C
MSRISQDEVMRMAELARLLLSEEETQQMTRDLDRVLDYVATLASVETEGVEPTAHVLPLATPLREDRAAAAMDPELAMSNAPERAGSAFVVPKVIEGGDEG